MDLVNLPDQFAIVVPTLNEEECIESFLFELSKEIFLELYLGKVFIVDDNSIDKTRELALNFDTDLFNIEVIHRLNDKGYGASCREGISKAFQEGFELVVTMDVDGSHNVKDLKKLLVATLNFDGIVVGSRYVKGSRISGWPLHRRAMSKFANLIGSRILNIPLRDKTNGFRAYKVDSIGVLSDPLLPSGYDFLLVSAFLWHKKGKNFKEIPIHFENRILGKSNLRINQIIEWFIQLIKLRFWS